MSTHFAASTIAEFVASESLMGNSKAMSIKNTLQKGSGGG
jgi:hypothetical protein